MAGSESPWFRRRVVAAAAGLTVRAGEVTVIDVRPHEEYVAGHIPGAFEQAAGQVVIGVGLADAFAAGLAGSWLSRLARHVRGPVSVLA